jgi:hypothetical protein
MVSRLFLQVRTRRIPGSRFQVIAMRLHLHRLWRRYGSRRSLVVLAYARFTTRQILISLSNHHLSRLRHFTLAPLRGIGERRTQCTDERWKKCCEGAMPAVVWRMRSQDGLCEKPSLEAKALSIIHCRIAAIKAIASACRRH